jgi:hypothetical protein
MEGQGRNGGMVELHKVRIFLLDLLQGNIPFRMVVVIVSTNGVLLLTV